jgi:hypothetical protein
MAESEGTEKEDFTITHLVEIVALVILAGVVLGIGVKLGSSETILRNNIAEDLRMMVDTLISVPGDAVLEYPRDVSGYIFLLNNQKIDVFMKNELESQMVSRNFILPLGYSAQGNVNERSNICLEKNYKTIFIRECGIKETFMFTRFEEMLKGQKESYYIYDAGTHATELYYMYADGKWKWSPDLSNWMDTQTLEVKGGKWDGKEPVKENIELIKFLQGYNPNPEEY